MNRLWNHSQDVLLGKQTSLQLLEGRGSRELVSIWEQPVVGRIIDLGVLPYSADYRSRHLLPVLQGLDLAVLLTDAGKVMFVYFDVALHRFQIASEIPVFPAGLSHKEGGQMLAVDPHGRAIAVAGAGGGQQPQPQLQQQQQPEIDAPLGEEEEEEELPEVGAMRPPDRDATLGDIVSLAFLGGVGADQDCRLVVLSHSESTFTVHVIGWELSSRQLRRQYIFDWDADDAVLGPLGTPLHVTAIPDTLSAVAVVAQYGVVALDWAAADASVEPQAAWPTRLDLAGMPGLRDGSCYLHETPSPLRGAAERERAAADTVFGTPPGTAGSDSGGVVAAAEPAKRRQWAMRLENAVTQAHGCLACLLALPSGDVIVSVDKSNTDLLEPMGAAGLAVSPARRTFLARHAGLQRVGTLVEGGPIADFALGDPQHLGENKVYAACGRGSTGSIRILHTSRLVETLYESEADYLGVTGLWSLKACERNEAHCLVVLSFVSGSRAMAAGTTLCDVTDAVGLAETEQTLACGRVDDHVLAQVTHGCVLLCHMGRALNQESDPATFHSTRRPYFSATSLRDLDINAGSPARDPAQDAGSLPHGAMDAPCGWGDSATGQAQARSSADSMLSCSSTSRLSETSSGHGVRGPEDVWTPPDGASISTAEVTDGLVLASCSHIKGLIVLQVGATDYGDGQGATSSPGKRKRLHRHWSLTEACQHAMPAEASCVHIIPDASGAPDTKLCAVGTYAPSIELLRISHRPGQAQQALRVPAVADGDIPESVLLLPSRALDDSSSSSHRSGTHIEVLIGWRSGVLQQLQLPLPGSTPAPAAHPSHHASSAPAPAAHPSQGTSSVPVPAAHASHGASSAQQPPPSRWATARQLGGMPVFLSAMPDGYAAPCFAISDRLSLLDFAPASGLVTPTALALTDVIRAVPLVQPTEALSPEAGISSRFTLLCATQQGVLTLLDLSAQCRPSHMRTWPLQATPLKVAMLDSVPALAVLCSLAAPDGLNPQHELRCLDPVTGQQLACMSLQPREQGACLCVCSTAAAAASQNVPPGQPADSHIPGIPRPQAPREGPTAFDDIWEFPEEAPPAEGVRTESGQDGTAAAAASEAQTQVGEFLVVGTTRNMEPRVRADRETWLGRLLVLQVVGPRQPGTGPQLILVDQIKLSDPVHAVCYHRVGSEPSEPSHMRFVASVGKRLVSFELVGQRLYRGGWTPTRRVVTSLSWHPCHPGYLCAADPANSVVIYSFNAAATTEPFQAVCADAMSRPIADAVMVDRGWRALALSTLGQLVVLGPQRVYCGPERNMDTLAHFRTGEVALRMLPGDMRIQYESGSDEGQAGPSTSMEPGTPESWTIGTLQGSVREVRRLLPAQHAVLAAVERVLGRHPCTAPISGHRHAQYRSSTFVGPGVQGSWQSSQAINILDGDLLSQLPSLPQQVQQSILQGVQAEDFSSACTQEEAISLLPWAHSAAFVSALILHLLAD
ncbi:hypothetical protein WJX72_004914 [[Myrmecia] bisecta]|uniref:Uncharacterized protein n=1 Tax=[Myrmecia] bisecta TaxID=41462 RepID=A0AAW1R638_9CHLO